MATPENLMKSTLDNYFLAWKTQDPELLTSLFAPRGVYRVKPFGVQEYVGRDQISEYWKTYVVAMQTDPQPALLTSAFGENICFAEWENRFIMQNTMRKITRGILLLEFEGGLIKELREHYMSVETQT